MKRFAAFLLLLVYFTISSGFVVSLHYCMGRFDSAALGASRDSECGKCGMPAEPGNDCCRDELKVVKLKTDHFGTSVAHALAAPQAVVLHYLSFGSLPAVDEQGPVTTAISHSPPLPGIGERYLHLRVFRL